MTTNPDNEYVEGLGPSSGSYLSTPQGTLRFIERDVIIEGTEVPQKLRILQQYQWCQQIGDFDWYDIPLVKDDG